MKIQISMVETKKQWVYPWPAKMSIFRPTLQVPMIRTHGFPADHFPCLPIPMSRPGMRRLEDKILSDTQELASTPSQIGFELKCRIEILSIHRGRDCLGRVPSTRPCKRCERYCVQMDPQDGKTDYRRIIIRRRSPRSCKSCQRRVS